MKLTDEDIAACIRGERELAAEERITVLEEVLRARRVFRADSRRAEQVRRLRWAVENLIVKAEGIGERVTDLVRAADPMPEIEWPDAEGGS